MSEDRTSSRRRFLKMSGIAGVGALAGCTGSGGGGSNGGGSNGGGSGGNENSGGSDGWTPSQNVRVIVPWGAGGGTDTAVRQVVQPVGDILQERGIDIEINVENITGAGGLNAASTVLNQPADGHTIFADTNVIAPNVAQDTDAFTLDDWAGIARVQYDTTWIFSSARDGNGFSDIQALVDQGKSQGIQFGVSGGLDSAVFPIQFAQEAGFLDNLEIVAYSDAGRMENDVITGEIDCAYGELVELESLVNEGEINLLFAGVEQEVEGYEDVPNISDTGWEATFGTKRALVVQDGTPEGATQFWSDVVKKALESESYQKFESENYLDIREGYLPGPEYMSNLEDMVELFETTLANYNPE